MIQAGGPPLEEGRDDRHAAGFGDLAERLGAGAGDRLGQVEQRGVLPLAEVLRAKQLRQADDLRTVVGRPFDEADRPLEVVGRVGRHGHLHKADGEGV